MRLKLIACEILYREFCAVVARSTNFVDVQFLPKGLHDIGQAGMSARLAEALAAVDQARYDAVLLGYGLCNNGVVGLSAGRLPLVVPRAHDCMTLFLGSKERYLDYFHSHPGVYFKTSGWIERGDNLPQRGADDSIAERSSTLHTYEELVARYGEDNGKYLYEQLCNMTHNYRGLTYIATGVEPDGRFEEHARREAAERGWQFDRVEGTLALAQALVDGPWDTEQFLVVPPGHRVAASFDDTILKTIAVEPTP